MFGLQRVPQKVIRQIPWQFYEEQFPEESISWDRFGVDLRKRKWALPSSELASHKIFIQDIDQWKLEQQMLCQSQRLL